MEKAIKMDAQERKWQAESDAATMARYQEIMSDKARMSRAVKEAQRQARDLNARASAMRKAASGGSYPKTSGATRTRKK